MSLTQLAGKPLNRVLFIKVNSLFKNDLELGIIHEIWRFRSFLENPFPFIFSLPICFFSTVMKNILCGQANRLIIEFPER
ncbi:TPA: hypothetical protein ACX6S1_003582 [Photobacterium damselae]